MLTFAAATATGDTSTLKPEQHEQKATRITQGYLEVSGFRAIMPEAPRPAREHSIAGGKVAGVLAP
jgi:hypothetical protein